MYVYIYIYICTHVYTYLRGVIWAVTFIPVPMPKAVCGTMLWSEWVRPVCLLRVSISEGLTQANFNSKKCELSCPYNFIGSLPESSTRGLLVGKLLVGGLGVYYHMIYYDIYQYDIWWQFLPKAVMCERKAGSLGHPLFLHVREECENQTQKSKRGGGDCWLRCCCLELLDRELFV